MAMANGARGCKQAICFVRFNPRKCLSVMRVTTGKMNLLMS